jgi:hypothetical protein
MEYRTAMISELIQYYALYNRDGLKSLGSEYSLKTTYTEEHETLDVIFDRHGVAKPEDQPCLFFG